MHKISNTSKRKRKLNYDYQGNQVVVSSFDTPKKKMAPKQREHRISVSCHGDKDWDRRMEGFEGIAPAREESGPNPDNDCSPVDIDWASESEDGGLQGQEVPSSSQPRHKDTPHGKESNTSVGSSKERPWCRSASAFPGRTFTEAVGSGRTPAGRGRGGGKRPGGNRRAVGPQSTHQDSLEVSISDYDSDTGEESEEFDRIRNDPEDVAQTTSSLSPVIASLTPSMSPSPSGEAAANRSKVSDWVKSLQWQDTTPEKQNDAVEESNVVDSSKKKPKYVRNGLADQLQRLIAREKSAVAFWLHKLTTNRTTTSAASAATAATTAALPTTSATLITTPTTAVTAMAVTGATTATTTAETTTAETTTAATKDVQDSRVLAVRVVRVRRECSLLVADCSYLPSTSAPRHHDNVVVLFGGSSKVTPGCGVNIHPPWQSLDTGGRRVILCAHFHEVFPLEAPAVTLHSSSPTLLATWRCPCELDSSMLPSDCLAVRFPCSTALTTCKSTIGDHPSSLSQVPTGVSSVHTDHPHKLVAVSGTEAVTHCGPCLSILDSVERQGGGTAGIGFTGTVQRVFSHCTGLEPGAVDTTLTRGVSWSLLVQDVYGAVCHIEVTDRLTDRAPWMGVLHSGEGEVYSFTGLRLVRRTSRARCASLFSIIDTIWSTTAKSRQEDGSQDSSIGSEPVTFTEPPGFCYHLVAVSPDSVCLVSPVTPQTPSLYRPVCHTPLVTLADTLGRVTLLVRVLYHKDDICSPSVDGVRSIVYVTDANGYVCVMVKQSCCLPSWLDTGTGVVVFKDVLSHQPGRCYFDPYSRVYDTASEDTLAQFSLAPDDVTTVAMATISPPPLAPSVHVYDLVEVKGQITGVDESTAFSWLECDGCHSDKLVAESGSRGTFQCGKCEKRVEQPIARVNMDVFVRCLQPQNVIKVKLQQPTIETLLPEHKDDEGYDVESVLGKTVGPLTCVVVSTAKRKESGRVVVLQEMPTKTRGDVTAGRVQ